MKLAKQLIRMISDYYARNNLGHRMSNPITEEYLDLLKEDVITEFLTPLGYFPGTYDFEIELKDVPDDILTRVDLCIKGGIFLYVLEILSWNELKVLLNIGSTGVILFKDADIDPLGAYDIIIALLAVLFGTVNYDTTVVPTYNYERLVYDNYYCDLPWYYYGYKAALSYNSIDDILSNIQWFLDENPSVLGGDITDKYDVLGLLRINNKFTQYILDDNSLGAQGIVTELDNVGYYNVALNLIRLSDTPTFGLNNTLFDFYKGVTETTRYTDDEITFIEINWSTVRTYSKYVDTVMDIDTNKLAIEKVGNILRDIQNFLIH